MNIDWERLERAAAQIDSRERQEASEQESVVVVAAAVEEERPRHRRSMSGTLKHMFVKKERDDEQQQQQQPGLDRRRSASVAVLATRRRSSSGKTMEQDVLAAAAAAAAISSSPTKSEPPAFPSQDKFSTVSRSLLDRLMLQTARLRAGGASSPRLAVSATLLPDEDGEHVSAEGFMSLALANHNLAWPFILTHRMFGTTSHICGLLEKAAANGRSAQVLGLAAQWVARASSCAFLHEARGPLVRLLNSLSKNSGATGGCAAAAARLVRELEAPEMASPRASSEERSVASLEHISADEFAEQLTVLTHKMFRKILPHELLLCRWTREDKFMLAPNVIAATNNGNVLTQWMITRIVDCSDQKTRTLAVTKLIGAGAKLAQLRNYTGVMQIVSALSSAPVARLRQTWAALPKQAATQLESLRALVLPAGNFRALRALHDEALKGGLPMVPYLGLWLTDLVFLDEMNATSGGKVSLAYLKGVARVLENVLLAQKTRYELIPSDSISDYIVHSSLCIDEAALFDMSLRCEPKV